MSQIAQIFTWESMDFLIISLDLSVSLTLLMLSPFPLICLKIIQKIDGIILVLMVVFYIIQKASVYTNNFNNLLTDSVYWKS